jgi:hypothetical protein
MTASTASGASLSESPLDKLKNRAKADIVIQIWWKVSKTEQGKVISFVLEAFDAYTSKRIAASSGNSTPNSTDIVPVLLQTAILANIDDFVKDLQSHFDDMFTNGREIRLTVRKWNNWDKNLEDEIEGEEIINHITTWMDTNTVQGRFNKTDASESIIRFEQVRIPLFDDKNKALDARDFGKKLQKFLKAAPYNFEVKLMTRGLGEVILVLGEK